MLRSGVVTTSPSLVCISCVAGVYAVLSHGSASVWLSQEVDILPLFSVRFSVAVIIPGCGSGVLGVMVVVMVVVVVPSMLCNIICLSRILICLSGKTVKSVIRGVGGVAEGVTVVVV